MLEHVITIVGPVQIGMFYYWICDIVFVSTASPCRQYTVNDLKVDIHANFNLPNVLLFVTLKQKYFQFFTGEIPDMHPQMIKVCSIMMTIPSHTSFENANALTNQNFLTHEAAAFSVTFDFLCNFSTSFAINFLTFNQNLTALHYCKQNRKCTYNIALHNYFLPNPVLYSSCYILQLDV